MKQLILLMTILISQFLYAGNPNTKGDNSPGSKKSDNSSPVNLSVKEVDSSVIKMHAIVFPQNETLNIKENDSIFLNKEQFTVTPGYYMVDNMMNNLPVDPNYIIDTIPSNKMVVCVKKNFTNNTTIIEVIYKAGSLLEDSTKRAYAFFTASYAAKYYSKIIEDRFLNKISQEVNLEVKPEFTKFLFSLITTDTEREEVISGFLKAIADSIVFSEELLELNKAEFISGYKQKQLSDLLYGNNKQVTDKYLNTITITKLRGFYKDWYRPDLMSVFIIGDIDTKQTKKDIVDIFSPLLNPLKEKPIIYYGVSKRPNLQFSIINDTTLNEKGFVQFYFNSLRNNRATIKGYTETTLINLVSIMMNKFMNMYVEERKITKFKPTVSYTYLSKLRDIIELNVECDKNYLDTMIISCLSFSKEVFSKNMFDEKILDIAKAIHLNNLKINETKKKNLTDYADNYLRYFVYNIPIINSQAEFGLVLSFIEKIDIIYVNEFMLNNLNNGNITIVVKKPPAKKMLFNSESELLKKYNTTFSNK